MSSLGSGGKPELLAVVGYLPEPIAGFVNRLRRELAPECRLRAHITVLPPRAISCPVDEISAEIEKAVGRFRSLRIEVNDVHVFPSTEVVHLSIGGGDQHLRELHAELNRGRCLSMEMWGFVPHITLAQDIDLKAVPRIRDLAIERWREYAGPREFALDHLTLVQGNLETGWADLTTWELASPVLA